MQLNSITINKISIIIISYNRPKDLLDLLTNISNLNDTFLLESVIILNNNSTVDYSSVEEFIKHTQEIPFMYKLASENLGVAGGRNYAVQFALGEVLLYLDDDILLPDKDTLSKVFESFDNALTERPIGVVSYKVIFAQTNELQRTAFPHKKFIKYINKSSFLTSYYAGCAHAKLKKALQEAGPYPEDFFYGMEEYDYSYRVINKGYSIQYNDLLSVIHKESPLGRKTKSEQNKMMWVNKTKVSYRYLPGIYIFTTALFWGIYFLFKSNLDIKMFQRGLKEILEVPKKNQRTSISSHSLNYLKKVEARLWY